MNYLQCGNKRLNLSKTSIMGILNVTPDSFSDGGKFNQPKIALKRAIEFLKNGADIIDIGGESTRPNAAYVSKQEEIDRVMPVLELILKEVDILISLDTSNDILMKEAISSGIHIINDIRSFSKDKALEVVSQSNCGLCLMHMRGSPSNMQSLTHYDDLMVDIYNFLKSKIDLCLKNSISKERIMIDPGFGFAKNHNDNLKLTKYLNVLSSLNCPILFGASRKSTIDYVINKTVNQRLYGSLALAAIACFNGAKIIRVHDVKESFEIVKIIDAVLNSN